MNEMEGLTARGKGGIDEILLRKLKRCGEGSTFY